MSFKSIVVLFGTFTIYFMVLNNRLIFEEKMLIEEFGNKYKEYMKKTYRLFPKSANLMNEYF